MSLEFTKKGVSKHCCDLSIRARQDNYYPVQGLDSAHNSSTIPQNLDFEERLGLFNVISERYRTRLIHTIFDIFFRLMQKHCWPEVHKLQNRARHCNLAKPWLDTSLERHLRHGHLRDIAINFLCDLYGKKLFPIISAPNIFTRFRDVKQWNKTFKNEKKISLKIWKKILKLDTYGRITHLSRLTLSLTGENVKFLKVSREPVA